MAVAPTRGSRACAPVLLLLCGFGLRVVPEPRAAAASVTAGRAAASEGGSINKLRAKANRPKPPLRLAPERLADASSALPPGTVVPEPRARAHSLLRERPELLEAFSTAANLRYLSMGPQDAEDLHDLQGEWFPEESYPGGVPWCAQLLAHPGVVAIKATLPGDASATALGVVIALSSKEAIEEFGGDSTVDMLCTELTRPYYIPWESSERRELGYVLSLGIVGEVRRKGVAAALLRRGLGQLRRLADEAAGGAQPNLLDKLLVQDRPQTTALRAVALNLADYNMPARQCYEAAGFKLLKEFPNSYAGEGRRTHSSLLYAIFPK